jgi:SM-20-related protein
MTSLFDHVADGLAEHGYAVCDQFLSQSEVRDVVGSGKFQSAAETFRKAGIGKTTSHQINEGIRGDYIQWIEKNTAEPPLRVYLDRVDSLISHLNQSLFLSLKDFEVHMTVYPAGSFYKRHLDQFKKDDHRKLSIITYLNEAWLHDHGGQLRMYFPDGAKDIFPIAGRMVCFRSDQIEHEVLPAARERLSLTGWILDQLSDLRHL